MRLRVRLDRTGKWPLPVRGAPPKIPQSAFPTGQASRPYRRRHRDLRITNRRSLQFADGRRTFGSRRLDLRRFDIDARLPSSAPRSQNLVEANRNEDDSTHHDEFERALDSLQVHDISEQLNHCCANKYAKDTAFTAAKAQTAQHAGCHRIQLEKAAMTSRRNGVGIEADQNSGDTAQECAEHIGASDHKFGVNS